MKVKQLIPKRVFAVGICLRVLMSFVEVISPIAFMYLIDCIVAGDMVGFRKYIIIILVSEFAKIIFNLLEKYIISSFARTTVAGFKKNLLDVIFTMPYHAFRSRKASDYESVIFNDMKTLEGNYFEKILPLCEDIISLLIAIGLTAFVQPGLLPGVPFVALITLSLPRLYKKSLEKAKTEEMNSDGIFTRVFEEQLRGADTIKSYGITQRAETERHRIVKDLERKKYLSAKKLEFSNLSQTSFEGILWILIYFVAGRAIIDGTLTLGGFAVIMRVVPMFTITCSSLAAKINMLQASKPALDKCDRIISNARDDIGIEKTTLDQSIELKEISFAYINGEPVLDKMSFRFEVGKSYAIVGLNGCGKSTLLRILAGFYKEYEGSLLFDGIERRELSDNSMFSMSVYSSQDVFLFDRPIEENIYLGKRSEENVDNSIPDELRIESLIKHSTERNTEIGSLSGGERQRIAAARMLVNKKSVLLADEPTSALDVNVSQKVVQLLTADKSVLSISVTHDLSDNLRSFDEIVVMDKGRVAEHGSFDFLSLEGQKFRTLSENKEVMAG